MLRNASTEQLLELGSMLVKNMPRLIDEGTVKAWIGNPAELQTALRTILKTGSMARMSGFFYAGKGNYVTRGQVGLLLPSDGWIIDAKLMSDGENKNCAISVRVNHPNTGDYWTLRMTVPKFCFPIAVGTYTNAARNADDNYPGLDFSGCGRGCNTVEGEFTIHELEIQDDQIISLAADFIQYDEGQAIRRVDGGVRYNSRIPRPASNL